MVAGWAAALVLAAQPTGATGGEATIRLRCDGRTDTAVRHESFRSLKDGGVSTTTSYGRRRDEERVLFEMSDGVARLHLPAALITLVNSGGEDGWWPVGDLRVGEDAITGRIRINIVNKPTVRIDRVNGDIELDGPLRFRGQCENTAGQQRKF